MRILAIALTLVVAAAMFGCNSAAMHSVGRNLQYACDDTQRAFGLDKPSALHSRDLVADDVYEPYNGY